MYITAIIQPCAKTCNSSGKFFTTFAAVEHESGGAYGGGEGGASIAAGHPPTTAANQTIYIIRTNFLARKKNKKNREKNKKIKQQTPRALRLVQRTETESAALVVVYLQYAINKRSLVHDGRR